MIKTEKNWRFGQKPFLTPSNIYFLTSDHLRKDLLYSDNKVLNPEIIIPNIDLNLYVNDIFNVMGTKNWPEFRIHMANKKTVIMEKTDFRDFFEVYVIIYR